MISFFLRYVKNSFKKSGVSSHIIVKGNMIAGGGTQSLMRELKVKNINKIDLSFRLLGGCAVLLFVLRP